MLLPLSTLLIRTPWVAIREQPSLQRSLLLIILLERRCQLSNLHPLQSWSRMQLYSLLLCTAIHRLSMKIQSVQLWSSKLKSRDWRSWSKSTKNRSPINLYCWPTMPLAHPDEAVFCLQTEESPCLMLKCWMTSTRRRINMWRYWTTAKKWKRNISIWMRATSSLWMKLRVIVRLLLNIDAWIKFIRKYSTVLLRRVFVVCLYK